MTRKTLPTALLALAVLCGCGGAAETAASPSPGAAAAKDKKHQFESAKADCMKQKGFKYIPYVRPEPKGTDEGRRRMAGDYQAMKKYREKYGFGVFAIHVYPKELGNPQVKPDDPGQVNPNFKIQSSLSKAQSQAFRKAMDSCEVTSANQVFGLQLKPGADYFGEASKASNRAVRTTVNSDPQLVELATAMATCLKGKGYAIADTTPMAMGDRGYKEFSAQEDKLGRAQFDDVPDVAPPPKEDEVPMIYAPTLTPEQAKPYLTKEIKAALDDLECGKDFYPAYLPKETAIRERVDEQYGM
ncbi:hypothetical protein [Nonomuraea pusilla]|uniref:Lipoprotein n=1 Tax=Nonomuraea pusilla TaxID=46177 RepID=A0A1H8IY48_9ACTN|nr:hypothetical protein [Nonomuraea pusilla]SEN73269.1 hypothetical protein SAMN05660976_08190 [Nonomuraea pusilla]